MSDFIISAIVLGIVLLYGCVGEIIIEKAGHLNLGIPGIMCIGITGGAFAITTYMSLLSSPDNANWFLLVSLALLSCVLFSAFAGGIYAFLTITLQSNQNIAGLALTTFGSGFANLFMKKVIDDTYLVRACRIISSGLVSRTSSPILATFFSYGILGYLGIVIAVAAAFILRRTRIGLNLRAVGENPATADAAGINVTAYKYVAVLCGSVIAGIGGLYYLTDSIIGSFNNAATVQTFGWLAIALVIFTLWRPNLSILGSFVFGALYIEASKLRLIFYFLDAIPYLVTIIVLIITSVFDSKNAQPPASLGLNYFREER